MGCQKMLFINEAHLSSPYDGTLLSTIMLDADTTYLKLHMLSSKNIKELMWSLTVLSKCLGGLEPAIMLTGTQYFCMLCWGLLALRTTHIVLGI